MLKTIPWDIWAASALAVAVALTALFDPHHAILTVIFIFVCGYIVAKVINGDSTAQD